MYYELLFFQFKDLFLLPILSDNGSNIRSQISGLCSLDISVFTKSKDSVTATFYIYHVRPPPLCKRWIQRNEPFFYKTPPRSPVGV